MSRPFFAIAVCAILLSVPSRAWAEEGDTVVVQRARVVSDLVGNRDHGFIEYHDGEGNVIYSLDTITEPSISGQELLFVDEFDAGIQFILENGYPNPLPSYPTSASERNIDNLGATVSFGSEADFYITQLALWRYYDEDNVASQYKERTETDLYDIVDYVEHFVRMARERNDSLGDGDTLLDKDAWQRRTALACRWEDEETRGLLRYNQETDVYESQLCIPLVFGDSEGDNKYHVRVVGDRAGVSIVDQYGVPRESLPSGEGFRVQVSGDAVDARRNIALEVSCEVVIPTMAMYRIIGGGNYERMVGLRNESVAATFSETLVASSPVDKLGKSFGMLLVVIAVPGAFFGARYVTRKRVLLRRES